MKSIVFLVLQMNKEKQRSVGELLGITEAFTGATDILSLRSVIVPLKIMVNFAISVLFIILNLVPPFLCLAKSVLFCLFESSKWFKSDKILYLISVVLKQRIFKCRKEAKE